MNEPKTVLELLAKLKAEGVPPEHYGKHYEHFMNFKAREKGIPISGHFELTPICNLDCKMCYVHLSHCDALLSVDQWKSLMKQAHDAGMMYASLTGGECLTYPGFDELYLFLKDMGVQLSILSNGVLMDADRIAFLKQHPPRLIQITLYGSNEDAYEAVTGKRMFRKVYDNLMALKSAGLPVILAVTPNRFMVDDMRPLLTLVEETGLPYNINSHIFPPREETGRVSEDFTTGQYIEIYRIRNEFKGREYSHVDSSDLPDEGHCKNSVLGIRCGAGRSGFSVRYDGTMTGCTNLECISSKPLEIGFSAAWVEINSAANVYPRPMECDGCVYAPMCQTCVAVHRNAPEPGHCDPRICSYTKRLIQEGIFPLPQKE